MGQQSKEQAQESLAKAQDLINQAKSAYEQNDKSSAESLCRQSLYKLREAHLWQPDEPSHRRKLHEVGRMIHNTFGCRVELRDGTYWVNCPVLLSHNQTGFSIGGSAKVICSVCGQDNLTCPHVKGRRYDGVVANRSLGFCNICADKACDHRVGERYDGVEAFGIIIEVDLDHVAIVKNPANPLCVIQEHSLTESDLLAALPEEERVSFVYGETVIHCHHCMECSGTIAADRTLGS